MTLLQLDPNDPFVQRMMREEAEWRAAGGRYKDEPIQFRKGPRPRLEVRGEGEGRHPMMMSEIAARWDGKMDEDEFVAIAMEINEKYCDPPKPESKIRDQVRWIMRREPVSTGPKVNVGAKLDGPKEVCTGDDYVLAGRMGEFEGWFPLGEVSLILGSSGAGKTTWALQMLQSQAVGESFLGHASAALPYIIIMQDRSPLSLKRTFRRLGLDPAKLPLRKLDSNSHRKSPAEVVEELYRAEAVKPRIVFVEGLDIWTPDQGKMDAVAPVLKGLQEVATHYNFALIGTVGSPKRSKKDQYESPRDCAFGSAVWARMTETIVKVVEDYDTGGREVTVMPRNAGQEKFTMGFRQGKLIGLEVDITAAPLGSKKDAFMAWLTPESTWEQAEALFQIKRSTFYNWRAEKQSMDFRLDESTGNYVDG